MSSRTHQQSGFSLIEVMIVSTLFLVIAGATLSSFTAFERRTGEGVKVAEQVDVARTSLDRASRQLRNLARRIDVPVIQRALADDLVFQTSSPQKRWMRYCLQTTAPSSPGRSRLYALESSNQSITEPTSAMMSSCPGAGWNKVQIGSDYVVNAYRSPALPVFQYQCTEGAPVGCPRATALAGDSSRLKHINMTLAVDLDPVNQRPKETRVTSSVFLRNQNEPPVAAFTWTSLGGRKVMLNGSSSSDPEGRTLRYYFFKGTVPATNFCSTLPEESFTYYTGVAPVYTFPPGETSAQFTLVVCDAGDLLHTSSPQVVSP